MANECMKCAELQSALKKEKETSMRRFKEEIEAGARLRYLKSEFRRLYVLFLLEREDADELLEEYYDRILKDDDM